MNCPAYAPQSDLRYSKDDDRLLMLHNTDYQPASGLYSFFSFEGYYLSLLTMDVWSGSYAKIWSIDNRKGVDRITIGGMYALTAEPLLTLKDAPVQGCYEHVAGDYDEAFSYYWASESGGFPYKFIFMTMSPYPNPRQNQIDRYCE